MTSNPIILTCGDKTLRKGERTFFMGIVNVTPDSFSDGGKFLDPMRAVDHCFALLEDGADILDIGGFSTAPNAAMVNEEEELRRVVPVVEALVAHGIRNISVDTTRATVANAVLSCGASWINDQSAATADPMMPSVLKKADAVVLMHNGAGRNTGVDAGEQVKYTDVIAEVTRFFSERRLSLLAHGINPRHIIIDPGVGFGKGLSDSITLINHLDKLKSLGFMTLLGLSRKSFLGKLSGITEPHERDFVTLGAQAAAIFSGVNLLRTHNVRAAVEMSKGLEFCLVQKTESDRGENIY